VREIEVLRLETKWKKRMNFGDELKDGKFEVVRKREEKLVERVHL
jgi:hypothetical protein